ncbi:MAG: phosphoglycerate dehydrogenase [Pseudomonadota bacterium]|nr:phosphoglycerate dehydrogenase [Pseudomonadota bacterium]
MKKKVLISDPVVDSIKAIFDRYGVLLDYRPSLGLQVKQLKECIGEYDGIIIRSTTNLTVDVIDLAHKLKVIGRAGIGVDNVDIDAASARGIVVMNTPFGNSITTAEHTLALIMALARNIPAADASTQLGKWEKSKFVGLELSGKTLSLIGVGNIGSIVASRAIGLKMRVVAYDPFLSKDRAKVLGVDKVATLSEALRCADFLSLHLPMNEKTANIIGPKEIAQMKRGSKLINCARGGLVDEKAVADALTSDHLSGAAFDVFSTEPAIENPLFGVPNAICTPHLGASTVEAQENVAVQIAEQVSEYLTRGAISNALNAPSISREEAPVLNPWIKVVEALGSFAGQVAVGPINEIEIEFVGEVGSLNLAPLVSATIASTLVPIVGHGVVNMVSAPIIARERGIRISETRKDRQGAFESYVRLIIISEREKSSVAGTIYSDGKPRFIQIKGINLEAEPQKFMLFTTNMDSPGYIGALGAVLGDSGVNIATFALGRSVQYGEAIALLGMDEEISKTVLKKIRNLKQVLNAYSIVF